MRQGHKKRKHPLQAIILLLAGVRLQIMRYSGMFFTYSATDVGISSSSTLSLIVACPMMKTTAPTSSERTAIVPIQISHWPVFTSPVVVQGAVKITYTPNALATQPITAHR